jgi:hypothetical protein
MFFKKKLEPPVAPPKMNTGTGFNPFTQTKVEDDITNYEVPEFNENDLNFDLGLGEFMPESKIPPEPKGLPTEFPPQPLSPSSQQISSPPNVPVPAAPQSPRVQQTTTPNMSAVPEPAQLSEEPRSISTMGGIQMRQSDIDIDSLPPSWEQEVPQEVQQESEPEQSFERVKAEPVEDDLPRFRFPTTSSLPIAETSKTGTKITKKYSVKLSEKEKKEREEVQLSTEGLFVPKSIFDKVIILSEDTSKKTGYADLIKAKFILLSQEQDSNIEDLTRIMKTVQSSLLLVDTKIFGKGDVI